jgi:hypothetical protein
MRKSAIRAGVPATFILASGVFWFTLGPGSSDASGS